MNDSEYCWETSLEIDVVSAILAGKIEAWTVVGNAIIVLSADDEVEIPKTKVVAVAPPVSGTKVIDPTNAF